MLRVCVAERNIAARRVVGGKGEDDVIACSVVDARGLEEQTVWRVEENRECLYRGQVACEADVSERGHHDERGEQERDEHPEAENAVADARVAGMLFGKPSFTPCAQDGNGGGHGASIQGDKETCNSPYNLRSS